MPDVIAHRGARRLAPENTTEAFAAAVRVGSAGIELDVRRTADGDLVVHHDAVLADGRAIVESRRDRLPSHIPTLDDALDACRGAFVNIEIKNSPADPDFDPDDRVAESVLAVLGGRDEPLSNWLISSFRIETVDRCRSIRPEVPTAWLTTEAADEATIDAVAAAGHAALHPWVPTVDQQLIDRCHVAGLRVNTWTCNDVERAKQLGGWGIDGICTDVPDVIIAALAEL